MKQIKFGIFGLGRGSNFFEHALVCNGDVVAVCDKDQKKLNRAKSRLADVAAYESFDEFIEHPGLEAVFLCNYFNEHAPYAVRLLERGIHVLSECISNATMADGVALVRAAEKSDAVYMLAENYPYMKFNQEMRRVYKGGTLGKVLLAEGEYNHPIVQRETNDAMGIVSLCPDSRHWRYHIPRIYYITHALAPLMYITGSTPKRVTAMPMFHPFTEEDGPLYWRLPDRSAVLTCLNDDDSVFRVTGWSQFGAHDNSYRICAERGQIENLRGRPDTVVLRYNDWHVPEGAEEYSCYEPSWAAEDSALAENAGHGGGDYFVIKEFFDCIRNGRRPIFDVYFATATASVAILGHRSALEYGKPYDVPDFRLEEDRVKYENDRLTPMYSSDGGVPSIPNTERREYVPTEESMAEYDRAVAEVMSRNNK